MTVFNHVDLVIWVFVDVSTCLQAADRRLLGSWEIAVMVFNLTFS